ncbi:hypothetical protein CEUSTIGMA_g8274.t1 [Chlamydomonas eustigma]|uniref:Major facilitator superfamily (MFS) profile domain-containing protein n=1 Tax=Chlamydomonas eustigma TaxID=1157962 RepID=A0A250XD67_9CHLO|nr:hypothetical protein CEUSTIGMA_g8274.t1 [Chlamydomonas eustigma]|eukprot:GAX80839.1 hypothetical protein CEUSTIGMA_g8274.t1 [Chlamydomonas eustigma]
MLTLRTNSSTTTRTLSHKRLSYVVSSQKTPLPPLRVGTESSKLGDKKAFISGQLTTGHRNDDLSQTGTSQSSSVSEQGWWSALESRYKIVIACAFSFVICNMVNMSVAIIPMAMDFGWSPSVSGFVQSAFFSGYMLFQLPGGIFSSKLGGRRMLPLGVGLCSLATAGLPLLATTIPGLCISRAAVGLGAAVAPSAATDIIARVVPANERSRAVAFVFSGLHLGSMLCLLVAPTLISSLGWEAVFVSFGVLGLAWCLWFEGLLKDIELADPEMAALLAGRMRSVKGKGVESLDEGGGSGGHGGIIDADKPIPWRAFLRNTSVQALMYTHFCNNWLHYTMLAWLPTYFTDTLSVDLLHASQTALLPPLAAIAASAAAGPLADVLVSNGVAVGLVRKVSQCTAFLVPSAFLLAACTPYVANSSTLTVGCITLALGVSSFSLAGLYCTHQDMSPKYAPAMLGLTNTVGSIPGVLGVTTVGLFLDYTESWELALFAPSAFFLVTGAVVYTLFCRNESVDFDESNNSPFAWEKLLPRLPSWNRENQG